MAKHIHVWLGKTHDADGPAHAPAGSSKGGQFVSGSGGGDAKHHEAKAAEHKAAAATKGSQHADYTNHVTASRSHEQAQVSLQQAEAAHRNQGPDYAKRHMDMAKSASQQAQQAEAKIKPTAKARPNSSGVEVKHQPSGTPVKHQAPKISNEESNRRFDANRTAKINNAQSAHAQKTGQALNRHQAAIQAMKK